MSILNLFKYEFYHWPPSRLNGIVSCWLRLLEKPVLELQLHTRRKNYDHDSAPLLPDHARVIFGEDKHRSTLPHERCSNAKDTRPLRLAEVSVCEKPHVSTA